MISKVYKSEQSRKDILSLYDRQMDRLHIPYEDVYVDTRFGKSHIIKTGKEDGIPVLLFHGGNSTTPYYLRSFLFLLKTCLVYAVDIMGHPGKSAETVLSAKNLEYGEWAADVIDGLKYDKMTCVGGSFGAGALVKLMAYAPQKIEKAVLVVPSAVNNASPLKTMAMGGPMLMYMVTHNEKWLKRAILPMALDESHIDADTMEMVKSSFDNVRVKAGLPGNVTTESMKNFSAPVLMYAAEKDILFPASRVIPRARTIMPDLEAHVIENSGHMCELSEEQNQRIADFIAEQ